METNCKNCAAPIPNNRKCEYCGTTYAPEKPLARFQQGGGLIPDPLAAQQQMPVNYKYLILAGMGAALLPMFLLKK